MQNLKVENAAELVRAPRCKACSRDMRLVGVEWETESRDVYTFCCDGCEHSEVKRIESH